MAITIEAAMEWIRGRSRFGARTGFERVEALLQRIGNPEKEVATIHIAGTNGKGSTVTYLRYMLEEYGLKVGTFISPYVINYSEQIAINGKYISDESVIKYVEKYQNIVEEMDQDDDVAEITEFEIVTVIALDYFYDERVDVAVVEVGMGGLLDSTNVVRPIITAITTIGKDHTDFLGGTLEEIALHKAGIIKDNVPVVTGNIDPSPLGVIKDIASRKRSETYCYGKDFKIEYLHPDKNWGELFNFYGTIGELANVKVSLLGEHQIENAAVAIQLLSLYCEHQKINKDIEALRKGLGKAQWPARMEKISAEPFIILDGAHNDHAIHRLADNLKKKYGGRTIHILFSALSTKDIDLMIATLKKVPDVKMYLTTFDFPKAIELTKLKQYEDVNTKVIPTWRVGLKDIFEKISGDDLILITGSLYFISQVRPLLLCDDFYEKCRMGLD